MVKDIYAIYESYVNNETVGYASANNTERGNIDTTYAPIAQRSTYNDLGESDEEVKTITMLKGRIAANPINTQISLKGQGVVSVDTIRIRLGKVIELINTKAGLGEYSSLPHLVKDLNYYIQANLEVDDILKNNK